MHRRLREGRDGREAVREAVVEYLPIVVVAGLTVAAGVATLIVAESALFQAFGPGLAITVLTGLVVSITLVPALLAILGRWTFWPVRPTPTPTGRATRPFDRPVRRRALPARGGAPPGGRAGHGRRGRAARRRVTAARRAARRGVPGRRAARRRPGTRGRGRRRGGGVRPRHPRADRARRRPPPASPTTGSSWPRWSGCSTRSRRWPGVLGPRDQPLPLELGLFLAPDGGAARFLLILDSDPLGAEAIDGLRALQQRMPALLASAGLAGAEVSCAGDTALGLSLVDGARQRPRARRRWPSCWWTCCCCGVPARPRRPAVPAGHQRPRRRRVPRA